MRVAIVGAHGTGKSSIIERLNHPTIKEVARDVIKELGKKPQEMTQKELEDFQLQIYYKQNKLERDMSEFIADRGIYDNLAYVYFVSKEIYDILMFRTQNVHEGYDKVFYTPIEFDLVNDGVRFEDLEFQKEIDKKILEILDILNIKYEVLTGSIDERVETVTSYITKHNKT